MPPRGMTKKEKAKVREQQKKEDLDFRRNHVYCPECGHTADTFYFYPGDTCPKCKKGKFKAYKETVAVW